MEDILVSVEGLSKNYIVKKNIFASPSIIKAVDNVSFNIRKGEILGLIGESGSGKTTIGSLILRLISSDAGKIIFEDIDITDKTEEYMRGMRKDMQVVFQSTEEILDPKMTIEEIVAEPLRLHRIVGESQYDSEVKRLLNMVGLSEREKYKFPFQISGGQRQRIGIARAIATRPKFIVCDEPVSALDVSVQGQILNLLIDLKEELNLTYLFISHDLKVIKHICDRIAVMYKGKIVEIGEKSKVINNPDDNYYTKVLINSVL
jgi:ABC-type oligopeptide transport system ATPase subunit